MASAQEVVSEYLLSFFSSNFFLSIRGSGGSEQDWQASTELWGF